jgi:hypothetical protein
MLPDALLFIHFLNATSCSPARGRLLAGLDSIINSIIASLPDLWLEVYIDQLHHHKSALVHTLSHFLNPIPTNKQEQNIPLPCPESTLR